MKKFLSMLTVVAVLSATIVGCGDEKDKGKVKDTVKDTVKETVKDKVKDKVNP